MTRRRHVAVSPPSGVRSTTVDRHGGAAATYGFLFQILRTAEWALKIDLHAPERNSTNVTMVAEPRDGGDVQIQFPHERLVQQFKVREGRTWSLTDIVEEVLPDLYRAVRDEVEDVRYDFVTSGRMGDWVAARDFFRSLGSRDLTGAPLDAKTKRFRMQGQRYSERSLFKAIVAIVRKNRTAEGDDEPTARRKLWHLLSRFDFIPTDNSADAKRRTRELLSAYVIDDDTLDDKIGRLLDTVHGYTTEGDRTFTPAELLRDAGIHGVAFTKLPLAREAVRELTLGDMRRLTGYDHSLSVRPDCQWSDSARIRVFSGESGQGKSWRLGDLAFNLMEHGREGLVVFVRSTRDFGAALTAAAQRIVRDVLGYNTDASFEHLATKVRQTLPELRDPWLTVCIDDVRSSSEIIELCDTPLEKWGIRVAITALPRYSKHAVLARRRAVVGPVEDFSEEELRDFLTRHGRAWAPIPPDVRKTMRRPLLAEIFVHEALHWTPATEYELYDACWRRLSTEREQPDHPDDLAAMLALAGDFIAGNPYPWSPAKLLELRIGGEQQVRLETIGWLRVDDRGAARVWHDRLLNWALAEKVAEEMSAVRTDPDAMAGLLTPYFHDGTSPVPKTERPSLFYVPMDVIWICASKDLVEPKQLGSVISVLESRNISELYHLLGTVGPAIVPALASRLRDADNADGAHATEMNVRTAVAEALKRAGQAAERHVLNLLQDSSHRVRDIGVHAARDHPSGSYVTTLWSMHLELDGGAAPNNGEGGKTYTSESLWKRARLMSALTEAAGLAQDWLTKQIQALETEDRQAVTLAWILSSLGDSNGAALWTELKEKLFACTPHEKPGGLIACIRNFRDAEEVIRLEAWLTSKFDFAAPSSLGALAIVAPDRALEAARTGDGSTLSNYASRWLPWLMLVRPNETLALARERLARDASVPDWFRWNEDQLDASTANSIARLLSGQLETFLLEPTRDARVIFAHAAQLLRAAAHADVIDALRQYAGTDLEHRLISAAGCLPLRESTVISEPSADIRVILRRISDRGAAEAVVAALLGDRSLPDAEIDWAIAYPAEEVREALRIFTRRHAESWNREVIPHPVTRSVRAMALLGDDDAVVDAVRTFGANVIDDDVPWLMNDKEPMRQDLVNRLLETLASPDQNERIRALGSLRVSRRRDLVRVILEQAAAPEATSTVRYHALRAARDLVERGTEVADLVEALVKGECDETRHVLAELLFQSGTAASLDLAAVLARKLPFNHVSDKAIVAHFVDETERGKEMAKILESHLFPFPHSSLIGNDGAVWLRLFPVLETEELRQKALDLALVESAWIDSLTVIECVATFDADAAFDLANAGLQTRRKGRESLPPCLLKFNPNRVAQTITEHLPDEDVAVVRWSIGRVLRWSDDLSIPERIREMASHPAFAIREAGYDCAGWRLDVFGKEELRRAAIDDENPTVRLAARDALRRRARIEQTAVLRERLIASRGSSAAWTYAQAITDYGDPHLLSRNTDPLCIWSALKGHSRALSTQVEAWLNKRVKQVVRDAESEDFLRGRTE
jgi:hypothetical protein